jgi:hypothetical protein
MSNLQGVWAILPFNGQRRTLPITPMWKSLFLASGIFACIVGVEMLLIDSAVILPLSGSGGPEVFTAPDWAPWSLISAGAVTILNFVTLPTKMIKGLPKP